MTRLASSTVSGSSATTFSISSPPRCGRPSRASRSRPGSAPASASFPSSHTGQTFAVAAVVADRYGPGAGAVAYTLATAVGAARIIQERHWASDVVAGAALGWAIGHTLSLRRAQHPPFFDFYPFA